jgi:hypothetical protein
VTKPPDLAIVVAALCCPEEWVLADDVRRRLLELGHDATEQQVGVWLKRACRIDRPPIEARCRGRSVIHEYRVSRAGHSWVAGHLGLRRSPASAGGDAT